MARSICNNTSRKPGFLYCLYWRKLRSGKFFSQLTSNGKTEPNSGLVLTNNACDPRTGLFKPRYYLQKNDIGYKFMRQLCTSQIEISFALGYVNHTLERFHLVTYQKDSIGKWEKFLSVWAYVLMNICWEGGVLVLKPFLFFSDCFFINTNSFLLWFDLWQLQDTTLVIGPGLKECMRPCLFDGDLMGRPGVHLCWMQ